MHRRVDVQAFWNWLPAFREIAETEHLPSAAVGAHVTPAALSRTLRLLEGELGRPLFHRRGRGLQLNREGALLLAAVRRAMRVVHDAKVELEGTRFEGEVRIAAGGVGRTRALRAVLACRERFPGMRPWFLTPEVSRVVDQLNQGELDVVIGSFVLRAPGLLTEVLGYESSAVYCGPSHPLYGRGATIEEVRGFAFCAPPLGPDGVTVDGWPPEIPREIGFFVDRLETGLAVCASSSLLAVLPDALVAEADVALHRLPLGEILPRTPVIALSREPTGADDLVQQVLAHLRGSAAHQSVVPSR